MADRDTKRSPIWKYFEVCGDDDSKAVCKTCNDKVSRGGSVRKSYNTTNLRKHLEQRRHKDKHKEPRGPSLPEMSLMTMEIWQFLLEM